jgi:RimJ/RimL family protein N-acetyltransferase
VTLPGRYCTLEHLDPDQHAADLHAAYAAAPDARDWTYLPYGPFPKLEAYREWATVASKSGDPRHYAVIDNATHRALGTMSLMRHDPANGAIEVGNVVFSRALQRTPISSEAQFLFMRYVFDELGYRRYEWKCDSLNEPSRKSAERLGFTYEGTFRQAVVYKGRNRDTAWFAITDHHWPAVRDAFEKWLHPDNFDPDGRQLDRLRTPRPA